MKLLMNGMIAFCALILMQTGWAHEGHDHAPVSMKSAIEIGVKTAQRYAKSPSPFAIGQLPDSWSEVKKEDANIHENGRGYYVVALKNSQEAETLYIKIMLNGEIANANYSGDFVETAEKPTTKN